MDDVAALRATVLLAVNAIIDGMIKEPPAAADEFVAVARDVVPTLGADVEVRTAHRWASVARHSSQA